jgi:hypothetical protein
MATNDKTKCSNCDKQARTFICEGCLQNFCRLNLTEHFQSRKEEVEKI